MKDLNKLSLPITIIIASVIIGGFYFASQISKQKSIEHQQMVDINTKVQSENIEKFDRMTCASQSEQSALAQYENTCTYECVNGNYYVKDYEFYYKQCLQSKGLK